jgi:lysozyme
MKRRWKAAVGIAIVIAMAGAGGTYLYFREFEPDRARFPLRGIDVSHHQGTIDWAAAASDDVAFAYVKASEGGDFRDPEFRRNFAKAEGVGLPVGAYHFFTLCRSGADQALNFIDAAGVGIAQLPPVVDLEFTGNCDSRPERVELGREVQTFVDLVESRLGSTLIYYVSDDFLEAYGEALPPRPLWRRSILQEPKGSDWTIWQYHPAGRVRGIDGDVDLNVLSINLDELIALGRGGPSSGAPARR